MTSRDRTEAVAFFMLEAILEGENERGRISGHVRDRFPFSVTEAELNAAADHLHDILRAGADTRAS